jgi:acyl-coenzyme A thioesterase 9
MQHCSDEDSTTRPLLLVTASVDKIELKKPILVDNDLKIAGAVTYVGHSSIDIQIEVTQVDQGTFWFFVDLENNPSDRVSICIQLTYPKCDYIATDGDAQSDPTALTANFTFVARDSVTGKSAPVNRLTPETGREKQLFEEREVCDKLRKRRE